MEFHEKLQQLRKQHGLTQEALAEALFVSRAAVSKWESGRGYPGIDSLKAIAGFFHITVDALLSGEEILSLAEADRQQAHRRTADWMFGLLDCAAVLLFFLPLFAARTDGGAQAVLLPALSASPGLKIVTATLAALLTVWGILTLALQTWQQPLWLIIGLQPYAAVFLFFFTLLKVFLLLLHR